MDKLQKIQNQFEAKIAEHKFNKGQIDTQIEKLNKKLVALIEEKAKIEEAPHWIDGLLKPIAEELLKDMENREFEILGPFGMGSHTTIWFLKKGVPEKQKLEGDNCLSITFEPRHEGESDNRKLVLYVVNETKDSGKYPNGSLGEMNGFNHPIFPMPKTMTELKKWVK
jgi:hypothetical protein